MTLNHSLPDALNLHTMWRHHWWLATHRLCQPIGWELAESTFQTASFFFFFLVTLYYHLWNKSDVNWDPLRTQPSHQQKPGLRQSLYWDFTQHLKEQSNNYWFSFWRKRWGPMCCLPNIKTAPSSSILQFGSYFLPQAGLHFSRLCKSCVSLTSVNFMPMLT